ncbi:hypothetical protein MRX96_055019 [Rhipicephalus microplus]
MPILTGQRPRIFLSCTDPLSRNSPEHFDTWFTKQLSPVPAKTTKPQGPPLGPRNPTPTDQPTWADKVACKGEAHAAQRQGHSPQQPDPELAQFKRMYAEQAKEIQSLKEELAKQRAPESRESSIISGPVSIRGAKKRAGPTLQAEEQSEFDRFTANIYAILEQYRAETTAEYSAFNAKLESMQKQLIELAAWPAQMDARTKVLEEDLTRNQPEELNELVFLGEQEAPAMSPGSDLTNPPPSSPTTYPSHLPALCAIVSTLEQVLHDGEMAILLLLDIQPAFDSLPHAPIIKAVCAHGVKGNS